MIRQFKFLLAFVLSAFMALIAFNLSQVFNLKHQITAEIQEKSPSYKAITQASNKLLILKDLVTQAGLARSEEEISASLIEFQKMAESINQDLSSVKPGYFLSLVNLIPSETKPDLEGLTADLSVTLKEGLISIENSKSLLIKSAELADARKNLSKEYRSSFELAKHKDAWAKLSRAVLTVISSDSNKDVAYSGRALFTDANDYFSKATLSRSAKDAWIKIESQFKLTLDLALTVTSVSEDNQLGLFREQASKQLAIFNVLKETGDSEFNRAQLEMLSNANLAFDLSLAASLILASCMVFFAARVFSRIRRQLLREFDKIETVSRTVKSQSKELLNLGHGLADNSNALSAGVERNASAVHEIKSMIERTNSTSNSALRSVSGANSNAEEGESIAAEMQKTNISLADTINEVLHSMNVYCTDLKKFNEMMMNIRSKTSAIDSIVFQTKLLSFNASVEAARAGEHGKGFAVVAEEMGALAKLSGSASREINAIITSSEEQIGAMVSNTQRNVENMSSKTKKDVEETIKKAIATIAEFSKISESVRSIEADIQQISAATTEQERGIAEVSNTAHNFSVLNGQLSKSANVTATFAADLDREAESLSLAVSSIGMYLLGTAKKPSHEEKQLKDQEESDIPSDKIDLAA